MIAQMQKRARGISRVGRRLFPNLRMTGLPAAWSQLLHDPITVLDRRLASVTSDPTTASEEYSNGTMIDSPPLPHTLRQQPLGSSQTARPDHRITRSPDHRIYASQGLGDPVTALDGPLTSATPVSTQDSEENSNGAMIDSPLSHTFRQQPLVSSQTARHDHPITGSPDHPIYASQIARLDHPITRSPDHPIYASQGLRDPIAALDGSLASVTSVPTPDSEQHSTGTMNDGLPRHTFRQQPLVSSQTAKQNHPITRSPDHPISKIWLRPCCVVPFVVRFCLWLRLRRAAFDPNLASTSSTPSMKKPPEQNDLKSNQSIP